MRTCLKSVPDRDRRENVSGPQGIWATLWCATPNNCHLTFDWRTTADHSDIGRCDQFFSREKTRREQQIHVASSNVPVWFIFRQTDKIAQQKRWNQFPQEITALSNERWRPGSSFSDKYEKFYPWKREENLSFSEWIKNGEWGLIQVPCLWWWMTCCLCVKRGKTKLTEAEVPVILWVARKLRHCSPNTPHDQMVVWSPIPKRRIPREIPLNLSRLLVFHNSEGKSLDCWLPLPPASTVNLQCRKLFSIFLLLQPNSGCKFMRILQRCDVQQGPEQWLKQTVNKNYIFWPLPGKKLDDPKSNLWRSFSFLWTHGGPEERPRSCNLFML